MAVISQVVKNESQKSYLEVEGVPFLYNAVQSWFPPEADYEEYMKRSVEVGYKVFTFWLYWSSIEQKEGQTDFKIIDRMLYLADKYDVKLDIVWGGTDFCDHLDPRFAPEWILNRHDWHLKDSVGNCVVASGFDMGPCCAFDPVNKELFKKEKRILQQLFEYIELHDRNRSIIMIQIENEINIQWYHGCKNKVLEYINMLASAIKEVYQIATRVNIFSREMDTDIDCLQNVDAHGLDTYDERVSVTRRTMSDSRNSKMKYIAENAGYKNSTEHIITALVNGGFYNIYKIDIETVFPEKPCVYGRDWAMEPHTIRIKNLNEALNKESQLITVSPKEKMVDFNCELDFGPQQVYETQKYLSYHNISFKTEDGAVAMVVECDNTFYCFADGNGIFKIDDQEEVEYIVGDCLKIKAVTTQRWMM